MTDFRTAGLLDLTGLRFDELLRLDPKLDDALTAAVRRATGPTVNTVTAGFQSAAPAEDVEYQAFNSAL